VKTAHARPTAGILVVAALCLAPSCDERHPQAVATPPPVVLVSRPVERLVTDYQIFTARTEAVLSVDVKARVTGYLIAIRFKDGDLVRTGEVLFEIDERPYKATLDHARATLELNRAAFVKAQAEYKIGLAVQRQNPAAISEDDLTRRLGARDEAQGAVDQAKAAVESAQLNYDWCKVLSPIDGRINRHYVDVGNIVNQNTTTLTNIVSVRPIWAYFDVDENTARLHQRLLLESKLKSTSENKLPVDMAMVGDRDFPIRGVLDFVSNQLDPNTGSIRVRAVFPNEQGDLVAGMFGRVRVPLSAAHEALLVVDSAIGTNQGQRYVLAVNDQNEVEYRAVDVGQVHGGLREVLRRREVIDTGPDGRGLPREVEVLKPTERVIVDGLQRVRPGGKVDPRLVNMVTLLPEPGAGKATPGAN
jgi:RND family efflux transporter MFP subunit